MATLKTDEYWIATDRGRLYAKRWQVALPEVRALPPFVLLHDSLGSVALWRDFPEQLAVRTGRTVFAYDRLGFGQSDPYPGAIDAGFIGDEAGSSLRPLCQQLGIERFVAMGHSVGGCMAVSTAAQYPDTCVALITESAQAFIEVRTLDGIRAARSLFAQPGQLERLKKYHGEKAAWVLAAWVETWLSPSHQDWNLDAELPQVRCPVLALHGENDEFGSTRHPLRIAERVAGPSETEIFIGCGHVPHREVGEAVLNRIARWIGANGL